MKAHCLPFSQIPHTSRLFLDYLSFSPSVQAFYPRSPAFSEWMTDEATRVRYDGERRRQVCDILERQNRAWNRGSKTFANIDRLRKGALAAVTGQQVGLFGGPLFTIFKALSAVKLAEQATAAGVDCVPVFWLATEDHDLAEVNHTLIPGPDGTPRPLTTASHGLPDAPVSTVSLGREIETVVESAVDLLGASPVAEMLRSAYRPSETLGSAFARLFLSLFSEWGVILIDPSDRDLHTIVEPLYRAAIERAPEFDEALLARGKALEAAGYHQQVRVTSSSTLLFTLRNGARVPIHRRMNGHGEFLVEDEGLPKDELLRRIAAAPHHFSPNVLLRPVVQDYLLPTLVYTGGAAEVAYFAQAAVVYDRLLGRVTPILPRFSATLVEPKAQRLLQRYGLVANDVFHDPEALQQKLAARTLPGELQAAFDHAGHSLGDSLTNIQTALAKLDSTLVEAATHAATKMQYQLEQLRARAARAELRQSELIGRHAVLLSSALFPNKALQEREIAGVYFLSRYGTELLRYLYANLHTDCHDHQIIEL